MPSMVGKHTSFVLPFCNDKTHYGNKRIRKREDSYQRMPSIEYMLMNRLEKFGIDQELVHLVNAAILLLLLMMLGVFVIDMTILLALFFDEADAIVVMMMEYDRR